MEQKVSAVFHLICNFIFQYVWTMSILGNVVVTFPCVKVKNWSFDLLLGCSQLTTLAQIALEHTNDYFKWTCKQNKWPFLIFAL